MKNAESETITKTCNINLKKQQISLVVIRLEIDDLNKAATSTQQNIEEEFLASKAYFDKKFNSEDISNISNRNIFDIFSYNCSEQPIQQNKENDFLKDYSEKFKSKEEALRIFIGKRESHLISIETYYFDKKISVNKNHMHHNNSKNNNNNNNNNSDSDNNSSNNNTNTTNQQLVTNAMTMQKALETAYNDWNKEKLINTNQIDQESLNTVPSAADLDSEVTSKLEDLNLEKERKVSDPIQIKKKKHHLDESLEPSSSLSSSLPSDNVVTSKLKSKTDKTKQQKSLDKLIDKSEQSELKANETARSSSSLTNSVVPYTTEIAYYYGNPTVDLVKGFIHIYKDCNLTPFDESTIENTSTSSLVPQQKRSEMLCMISIPSNITCNELLDFVMSFNENMQYMRILRDTYPNQYMALLKFKTQKDADTFYSYNNNKLFNSIEENVCHLVFVERVEAINSSKGASFPIPGFSELPTCYICLERMDESLNGVITILCNHSFHGNCLSKWGDTCCPVCRYSQTPDYILDNTCTDCGSNENLWICLICGNVGCGRYVRGHAYSHFQLTQHTYSMQLGNNRVWDYAADNYVHRLIQNKTDGKLIQLDEGGRVVQQDEKMDSITLEYTYLLTSQLESQRAFFEDRLAKIEEKSKLQLIETENKYKQTEEDFIKFRENYVNLNKEKNALEKKCSTLTAKVTKLQADLNDEKELNKCLTSNQEIYQTKLNNLEESFKKSNQEKEKEIQELQLQLRDIMFYLDAQNKMSESKEVTQEEIQNSQLVINNTENEAGGASGVTATPSSKLASRRKRK